MFTKQKTLGRAIGITLFAYLFLSAASSLVSSFAGKFPTIQIIFIQNIVSFFCVLPLSLRHGLNPLRTENLSYHLFRDLAGVVSYFLFFLAIRYLDLINGTILNYTSPFFVPLIWWIWMKEKVEKRVWWSIIVGFLGVAVILDPSRDIFKMGFVFGIFAGITSAIAMCAIRVLNLKQEPMTRTLFYFFSISSILSFPFAWSVWVPPTGFEWLLASGIGVATAVGQIFLTIGYRYGCASYLSPLAYSVVIYNGLIGYFLLDAPITIRTCIGSALIIIGGTLTYLVSSKPFEHSKKENPPL